MPNQGIERPVPGGGGGGEPFRTVDAAYRQRLDNQVEALAQALSPHLRKTRAAPVRVKVIAKAAVKSHRPVRLFSERTCPIVGVGRVDELFVMATADGLHALRTLIIDNDSDKIVKELSSIESIETVTPA